ncbi:MAG: hypothetical protein JWO10_1819, partial [Microbacteriaceae bacterium]|nr:hypothetical protein [Microbacteriaceae bacterium]
IACTPAVDGGVTLPNMCYTIIKFELLGNSVGAWTTTTLGDKTAAKFIVGGGAEAGWWATKRVGQYIVGAQGAGLPELLAEMTNYQVFAVGASIGKSGPAGDSWLLNLTFGGISNSFGSAATPATPAGSPFSDSAAVQQYISANSINVPGDTANFAPTGDSNTDLSKIESEHTMNGQYDNWQDPTDAFADVYSFSDAAYLGTFPVINGSVVLTNADISALLPGSHYLLFQGQTSGTLGLAAFTVVAPAAALAATGGTLSESTLIVGFLLLAAGIAAFTAGRLGARRQR